MTNTRRKTFNTPLEWMRWALERPIARRARNSKGEVYWVAVSAFGGHLLQVMKNGSGKTDEINVRSVDCPLTAVEDEHGVIEEEKPIDLPLLTNSAGYVLYLAMQSGASDESQQRNIQLALSYLLQEAARIADERIAAATVEQHCLPTRDALFSIPGTEPAWIPRNNLRLKPKGESK